MGSVRVRRAAVRAILAAAVIASCSCGSPNSETARYVQESLAIMDRGIYADSTQWQAARQSAEKDLDGVESISGTYSRLARIVTIAGGPHSSYRTPAETAAHENAINATGAGSWPSVTVDNGIGILTLPTFQANNDAQVKEYVDRGVNSIEVHANEALYGWLIDIRWNQGGNVYPMLAAVSPLLTDGVVLQYVDREGVMSSVVVHGTTVSFRNEVSVVSSFQNARKIHAPIAVVQSQMTTSAGEGVAVAFRGQPDSLAFGESTFGFSTSNVTVSLSDGALIVITTATFADRAGNVYGGRIEPDRRVALSSAIGSAEQWVREDSTG